MPAFARQFDTGIPFHQPPRVPTRALPFNISVPRLPEDKNPTEDPAKDPTKNPNTSTTKQSNPVAAPKAAGHSLWGTIGRDIGIGAAGIATVGGAALGIGKTLGKDIGEIGHTGVDLGKEGLELGSQTVKHGADIGIHEAPQVGRNLLNWGEDALKGIETGAKATNNYLESTSNGGGLENAISRTGRFAPGAADGPPVEGGLKIPDTWGNIGEDALTLLKGGEFGA
jgi:hypothetical protein